MIGGVLMGGGGEGSRGSETFCRVAVGTPEFSCTNIKS